jgi:uncharacterized iron-regulated protein
MDLMDLTDSTTKKIILPVTEPDKSANDRDDLEIKITKKTEKSKRVITESKTWNFGEEELTYENIYNVLLEIEQKIISENIHKRILQQLSQKMSGYKAQDIQKGLFEPDKFVDLERIVELLIKCNLECFYCKNKVHVLYEYVREPGQWTLDRIDNDYGHNKDNLEVACLQCNIRRRTMYAERYVFTKQLKIIKKV